MSMKIKQIDINSFRGIPELQLVLDGKSLLLYGENGTGKSSIVDAVEFFFNKNVSHLKNTKFLSLDKHVPHINSNLLDVGIDITFVPGNYSLERKYHQSLLIPDEDEIKHYFEIAQNKTFILRRAQLMEFIISKPSERFRALANLIGISDLDSIELSLKHVRDKLSAEVQHKRKIRDAVLLSVSEQLNDFLLDFDGILPSLNTIIIEAGLEPLSSLELAEDYAANMLKSVKGKSEDKLLHLNKLLETLDISLFGNDVIEKYIEFNKIVSHLFNEKINRKLSLEKLLKDGHDLISEDNMTKCPLCGQDIDTELLLSEINSRLEIISKLSDEYSLITQLQTEILHEITLIITEIKLILEYTGKFEQLYEQTQKLLGIIDSLNGLKSDIELKGELKQNNAAQDINVLNNIINQLLKEIQAIGKDLLAATDLTDEEKNVLKIVRIVEQIDAKIKNRSGINDEMNYISKKYQVAEDIYSTFVQTKNEKVREIFSLIESDIDNFYSTLHPDDPHNSIKLTIEKRASANIQIKSFGMGWEDPRAYISEGHLDSLGLCVFLAFINKFNNDCSLVILDDVVSTIDSQHRLKICKLLFTDFKDKQFIITTHDSIWYNQLKSAQIAHNINNDFLNMSIKNWTLEEGPVIENHKNRWERIESKLFNGDINGAANAGRQYLEEVLSNIAEITVTKISYKKSGRYTVGDFFDPVKNRMNKLLVDSPYKDKLNSIFADLQSTMLLSNLLSHNNPDASNISIAEVRDFCNYVHDLENMFKCRGCGKFIVYNSDISMMFCSNRKCTDKLRVETN